MSRFLRLSAILIVSFSFALAGCSKKASEVSGGAAQAITASELLQKLPPSTAAFSYEEFTSPAFKAFKTSPWYQSSDTYLRKVSELTASSPTIQTLARAFDESGILKPSGEGEPFTERVIFAALPPNSRLPEFGVYARSSAPIDTSARLAALEESLKKGGLTPAREKFAGSDGLAVPLADAQPQFSIFIVVTPEFVGVTSTKALAERLLAPVASIAENERGINVLQQRPAFQRGEARLKGVSGQFLFGYVDAAALVSFLKAEAPAGTPGVSDNSIEALPFESGTFCRSMTEGRNDYLWLGFKEGLPNDGAKALLQKAGSHPGVKGAPANSIFLLSLDGAVIRAAKDALVSQAPPAEQSAIAAAAAPLDSITGASILIRNASGASPFPELSIIAASSDAAALNGALKQGGGALTAGGQLPVSGWQSKEIEGVKVDYVSSPLGIGLFIGAVNDSVVVSTADAVFADLKNGRTSKEIASFFETSELKNSAAPLVLSFVSGQGVAGMIESVQASLAMFTGGKNMAEQSDLASIRSMGALGTAVNYTENSLRVHMTYGVEKK